MTSPSQEPAQRALIRWLQRGQESQRGQGRKIEGGHVFRVNAELNAPRIPKSLGNLYGTTYLSEGCWPTMLFKMIVVDLFMFSAKSARPVGFWTRTMPNWTMKFNQMQPFSSNGAKWRNARDPFSSPRVPLSCPPPKLPKERKDSRDVEYKYLQIRQRNILASYDFSKCYSNIYCKMV